MFTVLDRVSSSYATATPLKSYLDAQSNLILINAPLIQLKWPESIRARLLLAGLTEALALILLFHGSTLFSAMAFSFSFTFTGLVVLMYHPSRVLLLPVAFALASFSVMFCRLFIGLLALFLGFILSGVVQSSLSLSNLARCLVVLGCTFLLVRMQVFLLILFCTWLGVQLWWTSLAYMMALLVGKKEMNIQWHWRAWEVDFWLVLLWLSGVWFQLEALW